MIKIKIYLEKEKKQEIELLRDHESIGRSRQCTLRLADTSISARHCELKVSPEGAEVIDSGSTNGTFVNEVRVDRAWLKVGDRIRIGRVGILVTRIGFDAAQEISRKKRRKGRPLTIKKKSQSLRVKKKGKPLTLKKKEASGDGEITSARLPVIDVARAV